MTEQSFKGAARWSQVCERAGSAQSQQARNPGFRVIRTAHNLCQHECPVTHPLLRDRRTSGCGPSLLNGKTALIQVKIRFSCDMILQLGNRCYWNTSRAAQERACMAGPIRLPEDFLPRDFREPRHGLIADCN